jgi:predicted Zn-dependent protease with MMP-like domain
MRSSRHDRHGRAARTDNDRRRRPSDGFRAAHGGRFSDLVAEAIAELPDRLAEAVAGLELVITDVPPIDDRAIKAREVPLAQVIGHGRTRRLLVYRRPIEIRATSRAEVVGVARGAIGEEVARAFGIDDEGLFDDGDDW